MHSCRAFLLFAATILVLDPAKSPATELFAGTDERIVEELPDSPTPQVQSGATAVQEPPRQGDAAPAQEPRKKSEHEQADEQIKAQEQQRVLGILPTFNTTYLGDSTVSMTRKQKFSLAFHSAIDPAQFAIAAIVAGFGEVKGDNKGFPWGAKGYGERAGAAYLDAFDGTMLGNAVFPSLLHQDPRYYRMGHGSTTRRLLYSMATTFVCRHDKTGKWEPNYSNVGGNIASGAISTLYYPQSDSGIELAISNGFIVSAEGAAGAILNEFWPDISRKFFHKDPTNGLDGRLKAADEAKKGGAQRQR